MLINHDDFDFELHVLPCSLPRACALDHWVALTVAKRWKCQGPHYRKIAYLYFICIRLFTM